MGTTVEITLVAKGEKNGLAAIEAGFAEVARLEAIFSSYRQDSDLSRVNRGAAGVPVPVPAELAELAATALVYTKLTGGAFNPLMGPVIKLWGIPENPQVPSEEALEKLRALADPAGLMVDEKAGTVALGTPGMALGLGGIAKGYTADRVAELLVRRGISGGIVAIAGDVRVFGVKPSGSPWKVGVLHPRGEPRPMAALEMADGAISTSGDYERYFERDGIRYHHILDPRTLAPARVGKVASVAVTAPSAVRADALATALFVMGPKAGRELVRGLPDVEALFALDDGTLLATEGWPEMPEMP